MRILVLMATRNGEQWIERQLTTVLAQQGVTVQVLVRDDASTDATREIVTRIAADDARLQLLSDHRGTGSAAKNFFELISIADVTDFDCVAFCDQDDQWKSDKLARATEQMSTTEAEGYSATVEAQWADGRRKKLTQSSKIRAADYLFEGAGQGCTFVMSTRLFRQIQVIFHQHRALLDGIHYHDWSVYALARSHGFAWHFDQQVTMTYHQHGANDTGARGSGSGVARRLALIGKGWYRKQVMAIAYLVQASHPNDRQSEEWLRLSTEQPSAWYSRWSRLVFVAVRGRRRVLDRCILVGAVMLGHL